MTYHTQFACEFAHFQDPDDDARYRAGIAQRGRRLAEAAGLQFLGEDLPYLIARTWAEMSDANGAYRLDGARVGLRRLVGRISAREAELLCEIEPELQHRMPRESVRDKTPHEVALFQLLREFAGWLEDECARRAGYGDHEEA